MAVANPLADVTTVLTRVSFGADVNRFIAVHNLTSMDDFELLDPDNAKTILKMYNDRQTGQAGQNRKKGFPVQPKLQGFLYWYHDQKRRQVPIVAANFTQAAMMKAIKAMEVDDSSKETDVEIEVGQIEVDMEWWPW